MRVINPIAQKLRTISEWWYAAAGLITGIPLGFALFMPAAEQQPPLPVAPSPAFKTAARQVTAPLAAQAASIPTPAAPALTAPITNGAST